jgi:hypothetical protein
VLAAAEHLPGDHDELAGDRDCRDVAAASARDRLGEDTQRPVAAGRVPGGLDEQVAHLARALFRDPPVPGRLGAGLAHARVEADVADQMRGGREATDLADRTDQRRRGHEVDAGKRHQPLHLLGGECELGKRPIDHGDLGGQEVDLAQARLDRLALDRQAKPAQRASSDPEHRRGR